MDWKTADSVITDVDGTLYAQRPVRKAMALRMARFFLLHPWRWKELLGIYEFRKIREQEAWRTSTQEAQIREAARRARIGREERLREAFQKWMFSEPLPLIRRHRHEALLRLLRELRAAGKRVIVYSDYAPEDKLAALELKVDAVYYPGRAGIGELKPSPKAMRRILDAEGISPERCVFFGDRPEKDGESAAAAGIRFLLVGPDGSWEEDAAAGSEKEREQ